MTNPEMTSPEMVFDRDSVKHRLEMLAIAKDFVEVQEGQGIDLSVHVMPYDLKDAIIEAGYAVDHLEVLDVQEEFIRQETNAILQNRKEKDLEDSHRLEELVNEYIPSWREIDPSDPQWYYPKEIGDAVDAVLGDISLWDLEERKGWLDTLDVRMAIERLQAKEKRETGPAIPSPKL